jgi:cytidylate kinase
MQLLTKGQDVPFQDVYTELLKRDAQDMSRKTDPLKITDDAWQIDTSDLAIEQVVELIVGKVQVLRE